MPEIKNFKVTDVKVQPASELCDGDEQLTPTYKTHSKKRGAVLMINNIAYMDSSQFKERISAENDSKLLQELFLQIGLEVESHINLTGEQMKKVITAFKTSSTIKGVDMVFIVIMGHGSAGVLGIDGVDVTTMWVEEQFNDIHCDVLKDVPKVIIYQTCCEKMSADEPKRRNVSDMLILHSTMQGDSPACNWKFCSLYINYLCETIMENAYSTDVETMLRMTNNEFIKSGRSELAHHTSSYMNLKFKTCFLHPNIYMEDGKIKNMSPSKA